MDAIQLVRHQATQDTKINSVTTEVTNARTSKAGTVHATLKERIDAVETKVDAIPPANNFITTGGGQTINGTLQATTFIGALQGNATTASKVNNALTINGVAYDGSTAKTINVAPTNHTHTGSQVTLAGYVKGTTATALATTDTVNIALGKLENQIVNKTLKVTKSVSYVNHIVQANNKVITQALTGYANGDIVEVYISGVLLRPDHHYKLSITGTTATLTTDATTTGNTQGWLKDEHITFKILKIN